MSEAKSASVAGAATSASTAEAATSPWTAGGITSTSAAEASADLLVSGALKGSPVLSITAVGRESAEKPPGTSVTAVARLVAPLSLTTNSPLRRLAS